MTGPKTWNKALLDIMEDRADDEFRSFMEAPRDPLLTPVELERRVARVMNRIDAEESPPVEVCVEGERLWLRATLEGIRTLGEHFIRTIGLEPEPPMMAVRRMTTGTGSESEPAVVALLDALDAGTLPPWIPVDFRRVEDRSYRLTLARTSPESDERQDLRLIDDGTTVVPNSVDWTGSDHVEMAFRRAGDDLMTDASIRIEVERDADGCLTVNLGRATRSG